MQHSHSRWQSEPVRSRRRLFPIVCVAAALPWLALACAVPGDTDHGTGSSRQPGTGVSTYDLEAGIEIALDPPVAAPAPGSHPVAAFDGNRYFVVWNDYRALRSRLYGARVAADGTVLDPLGMLLLDDIERLAYPEYIPAISFGGTNHLVAFLLNGTIVGLRVSPEGEVLDASPFPISAGDTVVLQPRLAFDGENHLVVWSHQDLDDPARTGIYVARVSPEGTVLDPGGELLIPLGGQGPVDVAFDGENYLLTWLQYTPDQDNMIMGARLTTAGTLLDPEGFRVAQGAVPDLHELSFDGTSYVVVWDTYEDERALDHLYATRVTPEGTVLEPAEISLGSFGAEFSSFSRVATTTTSAGTIVASSRSGRDDGGGYWEAIALAFVPVEGDAVRLPSESSPGTGVDVALATGGGSALALWTAGDTEPSERFTPIAARRLSADATIIDTGPIFVSRAASAQDVRAVASDGQSFFVLWTDARNPGNQGRSLYGARVSADGKVLDPEAILVTQEEVDAVDLVFDGVNYLVMFTRQESEESFDPVRAVRVSPEGRVLDTTPLTLPLCSETSDDRTPRAAVAGDRILLLANGCEPSRLPLAAVVIDRQGTPFGTPTTIVDVDGRHAVHEPVVASDGTGYLVVWRDNDFTLQGQRMDAAGALLGEAFPIVTLVNNFNWRTAVHFRDGHYHVMWSTADGLYGTRIDAGGQVPNPQVSLILGGETGMIFEGAVAFHGDNLVVAYRKATQPENPSDLGIHAVEVSPTGEVLSRFMISDAPETEGLPVLATNDAQQVLAAYTRYVPEAPLDARRARARLLVVPPEPEPGADAGPGSPDAGDPSGNPGDGEVGGCGCAASPSMEDAGGLVLLGLAWLLALRRRPARLQTPS